MLDTYFKLTENGTNVRIELLAGLTTFLTMAYIAFVNPNILAATGMDQGAVFVATCLAAAIGSLIMGLWANYPIALAPGMGLNAFFAFTVVLGMGHSWQTALWAVFIAGVLFFILSVFKVREWIINAIPHGLKLSIAAGIGLFLALIGLKSAGIVIGSEATLVTMGDLSQLIVLLAIGGFLVMAALDAYRVPGAITIAILLTAAVGVGLGVSPFGGVFSAPPSLGPTFVAFLETDLMVVLEVGFLSVVFAFLFVDLFDTAGTLIAVAHRGGMLDEQGRLPRLGKALMSDSGATVVGAALGTSTTTSYIESVAGVKAGGRTGLTAVTVAVLFLLTLFFSPLAGTIQAYATAPALVFVACMMMRGIADIDWEDATEYVPAVVTALAIPLTFSISDGIGFGFVSYAVIKILSGRFKEAGYAVPVLAVLYIIKVAVMPTG